MKSLLYLIINKKYKVTNEKNPKEIEIYKLRNALEITDKLRDIQYIHKKLHEFEIFKHMFLNESQILALSSVEKPLLNKNTLDYTDLMMNHYNYILMGDEEKEQIIISYFSDKLKIDALEGIDLLIFKILDPYILKKINLETNKTINTN